MHFLSSFTLATLALTNVVSANAVRHEEKRQAGCSSDNVLRALSAQSAEANSLCPSLILFRPTVTVTVPIAGASPAPV